MDDQKSQPEDSPAEAPKSSHWSKLAEALGANVKSDEVLATPAVREPVPPAPKKSDRKPKAPPKKPARSNWKALASMLGIGGGEPEELESEVDVAQEVALPTAEAPPMTRGHEAPASPSHEPPTTSRHEPPTTPTHEPPRVAQRDRGGRRRSREREVMPAPDRARPSETTAGPAVPTTPAPPVTPDPVARLGIDFDEDDVDISRTQAKNVLESMFKPSEVPYWEEEVADDSDDDLRSADTDVDAVRFERQDDLDYADEDEDADPSTVEKEDERPARGRRGRSRRRRRRGGRQREEVAADVVDDPLTSEPAGPSDSTLRLEASADLFDEADDDDDMNDDADFDLDDDLEDDLEPQANKVPDRQREKRRVTSWDEAIGVIVERNLKNRSNSGGGGGGSRGPRGRRR